MAKWTKADTRVAVIAGLFVTYIAVLSHVYVVAYDAAIQAHNYNAATGAEITAWEVLRGDLKSPPTMKIEP